MKVFNSIAAAELEIKKLTNFKDAQVDSDAFTLDAKRRQTAKI